MDGIIDGVSALWLWASAKIEPNLSSLPLILLVSSFVLYKGLKWYWKTSLRNAAGSASYRAYKEVALGRQVEINNSGSQLGCVGAVLGAVALLAVVGMIVLLLIFNPL